MSTQRNREIRRNTSVVMALLNLFFVFLVVLGLHRLEGVLYSRCESRVLYDNAQVHAWVVEMQEDRAQASYEAHNPFINQRLRDARVTSLMHRAEAAQGVVDAQVKGSCNRLRLLSLGT